MNCPRCDRPTAVLDTRPGSHGTIRRRRQCEGCGHRFTTYESRQRPDTRDRTAYFAARYAAKTPEQKRRAALRRQARLEATRTGEDVQAIYARWNVG